MEKNQDSSVLREYTPPKVMRLSDCVNACGKDSCCDGSSADLSCEDHGAGATVTCSDHGSGASITCSSQGSGAGRHHPKK
jgi:hypothetical protein